MKENLFNYQFDEVEEKYELTKSLNLPPLIEPEIFELNDFKVQVYRDKCGDYLVIDNFWAYPDKINELALLTPTVKLQNAYNTVHNGTKYYDGRSHFIFYAKPLFISVLEDIVNKMFNITHIDVGTQATHMMANNLFNITPKEYSERRNYYYGPHTDGSDVIACISYLNKEYSPQDGTVMFNRDGLHEEFEPWVKKSDVNTLGFLPAAYNRMIIYDGNIHHSSSITSRWVNEIRHSMVYFMQTYK